MARARLVVAVPLTARLMRVIGLAGSPVHGER
jgi:hypothetical protein